MEIADHVTVSCTGHLITAHEKNDKMAVAEKLHIFSKFSSKYK